MFKQYDSNIVPKHEPIKTKVAHIKFLELGMYGNVYDGTIVSGEGMVTVTIRELGIAVSVPVSDLKKALPKGDYR